MSELPIDGDALDKLINYTKAQEEANRLKQTELNYLKRREQLSLDERESTAKLRLEVSRMITELQELSEEIAASIAVQQLTVKRLGQIETRIAQIEDRLLNIEQSQILLLTEHNPVKVRETAKDLEAIVTQRKQLQRKIASLNKLKEQEALHAPGEAPITLLNKIDLLENQISELQEQLET